MEASGRHLELMERHLEGWRKPKDTTGHLGSISEPSWRHLETTESHPGIGVNTCQTTIRQDTGQSMLVQIVIKKGSSFERLGKCNDPGVRSQAIYFQLLYVLLGLQDSIGDLAS